MEEFFASFWETLKDSFSWVLDGALIVLKSVFYFILDGLFSCIVAIVGSLDVGNLAANYVGVWLDLPSQLIWCINAVGLPACLAMMFYAVVVRKILDLVPAAFTRF